MGKHTDVVTYPRDESPFGDELPVPGFIHRIPRPWAHGGVATMVIAWALGLRRIQTGYVMNYALGMLLGAVALVAFLLVARP